MRALNADALALMLAASLLAPAVGEPRGHVGGGHGGVAHTFGAHHEPLRSHAYARHAYPDRGVGSGSYRYGHQSGRWHYRGRSWSPYRGFGFGLSTLWDAVGGTGRRP